LNWIIITKLSEVGPRSEKNFFLFLTVYQNSLRHRLSDALSLKFSLMQCCGSVTFWLIKDIKKSQTVGIKVILTVLLLPDDRAFRSRIWEAKKHTDPDRSRSATLIWWISPSFRIQRVLKRKVLDQAPHPIFRIKTRRIGSYRTVGRYREAYSSSVVVLVTIKFVVQVMQQQLAQQSSMPPSLTQAMPTTQVNKPVLRSRKYFSRLRLHGAANPNLVSGSRSSYIQ
jgi:hypothetical protein